MAKLIVSKADVIKGKNNPGFYEYDQNNSGGYFIVNDKVTTYVIVEADNATEADQIAEHVGLYFGGRGDCPCCGDRWNPHEGATPNYKTLEEIKDEFLAVPEKRRWWKDTWVNVGEVFCIVYCLDGTVLKFVRE